MSTVNQHGVIIDSETIILASGHKYHLEARLAEHQGRWYAGASYEWGGTSVGSCGGGWLPWIDNNPIPPQPTKEAAIERVAEYLERKLNKHRKHWLPSAEAGAKKATMAAIDALYVRKLPKQMRLF